MGTLREDHKTFLIYLAKVFLEWEMFRIKFVEELKTHILCSANFFFPPRKSCPVWENVEKYYSAGQTTDDNMAHAQSVLDN